MSERSVGSPNASMDPPEPDHDAAPRPIGEARAHASVRMRRFAPREHVFQFGAPVDTAFELVHGCVVVTMVDDTGRRRIVDFVQPGRLFGFTAQDRHRCAAVAVTGATVCCLDLAVARRNDRVAAWLEREMLAEIDRLRDLAALLGRKAAIERITDLFSLMASSESPSMVHLPVTRGQIADFLGLTVETVCRNLTKLKREGVLVEESGGVWRIADAARLARRATSGTRATERPMRRIDERFVVVDRGSECVGETSRSGEEQNGERRR